MQLMTPEQLAELQRLTQGTQALQGLGWQQQPMVPQNNAILALMMQMLSQVTPAKPEPSNFQQLGIRG